MKGGCDTKGALQNLGTLLYSQMLNEYNIRSFHRTGFKGFLM